MHPQGFTLVETLVVLAIFTIAMLAITSAMVSFYNFNGYTIAQSYQVDHARRGIEFLTRDIREMTFADNGTFPLVIKNNYEIAFYSDIDRDDSVEYVRYVLSTTTLFKQIFEATGTPPTYGVIPNSVETISEYVQNNIQGLPIFTYYNEMGVPAASTSTVTEIKYVQANVIVNIDPVKDPGEYMLRSSASLRNLKTQE